MHASLDVHQSVRKNPQRSKTRSQFCFHRYFSLIIIDVLYMHVTKYYIFRPSGVMSDSEVGTPVKCSDKYYGGVTSDSEVTSPIKQYVITSCNTTINYKLMSWCAVSQENRISEWKYEYSDL